VTHALLNESTEEGHGRVQLVMDLLEAVGSLVSATHLRFTRSSRLYDVAETADGAATATAPLSVGRFTHFRPAICAGAVMRVGGGSSSGATSSAALEWFGAHYAEVELVKLSGYSGVIVRVRPSSPAALVDWIAVPNA
jgi:hypothetical protein